MSEIKVNSIKGVGASAAAITVNNTDGTCTANITNNLSNRNLIINGAMQVAQRGTSSTDANGFFTVDRIKIQYGGTDENLTQAQADVASGTTPYTSGFRKAYKITNGNQTGGAGAADFIQIKYFIEAQDIANSGWNYTDSNSKITLQFWVKSSVAQDFPVELISDDGTAQSFTFMTGSLTADTWTKVTKTISGDSNLQFDNNNGKGLSIFWHVFLGTDYTGSISNDTWRAQNDNTQANDMTSTWYTTNDATFEITGVQLEVGSVATDFEHRSFGQELYLCQRYFELVKFKYNYVTGYYEGNGNPKIPLSWNVEKRATPTITMPTVGTSSGQIQVTGSGGSYDTGNTNIAPEHISTLFTRIVGTGYGGSASTPCSLYINGTDGSIQISAEL